MFYICYLWGVHVLYTLFVRCSCFIYVICEVFMFYIRYLWGVQVLYMLFVRCSCFIYVICEVFMLYIRYLWGVHVLYMLFVRCSCFIYVICEVFMFYICYLWGVHVIHTLFVRCLCFFYVICEVFKNFLRNCLDASVLFVIFSSYNILGTHRTQMRFMCSSWTTISCTIVFDIAHLSATSRTVKRLSLSITSHTSFFTTSEVLKDGLPSRLSSIKLPLPSENLLCHLNTNERLTLECVTDRLMNLCVSVGVFPMSTQNFITALCSTLFENWTPKPSENTSDSNFTYVTSRALSTSQTKFNLNLHDQMKK
jgi:hypothetical protein